jgi:hypothetical protein
MKTEPADDGPPLLMDWTAFRPPHYDAMGASEKYWADVSAQRYFRQVQATTPVKPTPPTREEITAALDQVLKRNKGDAQAAVSLVLDTWCANLIDPWPAIVQEFTRQALTDYFSKPKKSTRGVSFRGR